MASIKCPRCLKVLSTPVLLPCGHSLCQEHLQGVDERVKCFECDQSHPKSSILVNKPLMDMISARIESLDFGSIHLEAKKSCNRFDQTLNKSDVMINDLDNFVHESVSDLKNKLYLKREEFKLLIDETTNKLVKDLDNYEKQCKKNLASLNANPILIEFKKFKDASKQALSLWHKSLNELKYNEAICKQIKCNSEKMHQDFQKCLESFERTVLMNEMSYKKACVNCFCESKIQLKIR